MTFQDSPQKNQLTSEPLLSEVEKFSDEESDTQSFTRSRNSKWRLSVPILIHAGIWLIYTIVFIMATRQYTVRTKASSNLLSLPANDALKWETRLYKTDMTNNPFTGDPRPELDEAWHDLLQYDNVRLPIEDFDRLGIKSVQMSNRKEAIAQLSVFHALHCLKKIRHWVHKDYYYPNRDEDKISLEIGHTNHCFEYIRESLMCKPDLSLVSLRWINGTWGKGPLVPTNQDKSLHQCADWKKLDSWAEERAIDLYDLEQLRFPDKGLEYSDWRES